MNRQSSFPSLAKLYSPMSVYAVQFIVILFHSCGAQIVCDFLTMVEVKENSPPDYKLVNLTEKLNSKPLLNFLQTQQPRLYLVDARESRPFTLRNGVLYTHETVDREVICSAGKAKPKCCDDTCCKYIGINGLSDLFFVKVVVEDVNDESPRFVLRPGDSRVSAGGLFTIELRENTSPGERIMLPVATDDDSEAFSVKNYSIRPTNQRFFEFFRLQNEVPHNSEDPPELYIIKSVDREEIDKFVFTLIANDGNNMGSMQIQINIIDVNDHAPKFERNKYSLVIPENVRTKQLFIPAHDRDFGPNAKLSYEFNDDSGMATSYFRLNHATKGVELELFRQIDYEKIQDMKFYIVAKDSGERQKSSSTLIEVKVTNVNDHPPEIRFYNFGNPLDLYNARLERLEGPAKGAVICYVHVTDADTGMQDVQCEVKKPKDMFHMTDKSSHALPNMKMYSLISVKDFDRERDSRYTIIVRCEGGSEGGETMFSEATLIVMITDVNDNPPRFDRPKYFGTVDENKVNAKVDVGDFPIKATDLDSGDNADIRYSITPASSTKDLPFVIDSRTGALHTTNELDYETRSNYTFEVTAADQGSPNKLNSSVSITVNLVDVNDNPPIIEQAHYIFTILEGLPPRTYVGQISATDADTLPDNKKLYFELKDTMGINTLKYFAIDPSTGIIKTQRELDREVNSQFHFTVRVTNKKSVFQAMGHRFAISRLNPTAETSVTVTVLDRNDNAPIMRPRGQPDLAGFRRTYPDVTFIVEAFDKANPCVEFPFEFHDKDNGDNAIIDISLKSNDLFDLRMDHVMLCTKKDTLPPVGRYTLQVVASDRAANDSKSSMFSISVLVRSDPSRKLGPPIGGHDGGRVSLRGQGFLTESRNITIIAVLVSLAGLFCLLLLGIVIALKRCPPPIKDYDEKDNDDGTSNVQDRYPEAKMCQSKSCDAMGRIHETHTLMGDGHLLEDGDLFCDGVTTLRRLGDRWIATTLTKSPSTTTGRTFTTPAQDRRTNDTSDCTKSSTLSRSCELLHKKLNLPLSTDDPCTDSRCPESVKYSHQKSASYYTKPTNHLTDDSSPPSESYQVIDPATLIGPRPTGVETPHHHHYYYLKAGESGEEGCGTAVRNVVVSATVTRDDHKKSLKNVYFQTSFV